MSATAIAKFHKTKLEEAIRDSFIGGEARAHEDVVVMIADVIECAVDALPRLIDLLRCSERDFLEFQRVNEVVTDMLVANGGKKQVFREVNRLSKSYLRTGLERWANHPRDSTVRATLVEVHMALSRLEDNPIGLVDPQTFQRIRSASKKRVLAAMHGSREQTHQALNKHGGLIRRDLKAGVGSSHTVKFLGENDPNASRIRGYVSWDDEGQFCGAPSYSIQHSNYLTRDELTRAAPHLMYYFGITGQPKRGHRIVETSAKHRVHRHVAHVTVWSMPTQRGQRFEILLYPRKHADVLRA